MCCVNLEPAQVICRALRLACERALPRHLVPFKFRIVKSLPRTGTGKVREHSHLLLKVDNVGTKLKLTRLAPIAIAPPGAFQVPDCEVALSHRHWQGRLRVGV